MPDSQTQLVPHSCSNVELRWLHGAALPAAVPVAMDGERSPSPGHAAPRQRGMQNTGPSAPLQPSLFFYKHNVWGGSNTALFPLRVLQLAPGSMQICALLGISAIIIAHGHLSTHTHTHTPRMAGSGFITTHVHALMVTACRKGTARGERRPGTDWEQRLLCTSCPHPAARAPRARCSRSHTPQHRQQRIKTTRAFLQTAPGKLRRPLRHKT